MWLTIRSRNLKCIFYEHYFERPHHTSIDFFFSDDVVFTPKSMRIWKFDVLSITQTRIHITHTMIFMILLLWMVGESQHRWGWQYFSAELSIQQHWSYFVEFIERFPLLHEIIIRGIIIYYYYSLLLLFCTFFLIYWINVLRFFQVAQRWMEKLLPYDFCFFLDFRFSLHVWTNILNELEMLQHWFKRHYDTP